ncbi:MAG: hypothetical protein NC133_04235 [Prevotella sp.]|nr:hypothetical protein [Prevotella sp.]
MGKNTTGEKPKFDLITASKTKKYKIITGVILGLGILILGVSLLLKNLVTSAVVPNNLAINHLSNLTGTGPVNYTCTISQTEIFTLTTGTTAGRALANPIKFTLLDGAADFLEVRDATDSYAIDTSYYNGLFTLHIRDTAPASVVNAAGDTVRPTGTLQINCGSFVLRIKFTYSAQ